MFNQRSLKMSGDLPDGEDVFEMTKGGLFDNETRDHGAVCAEADTPDPGQHRRVGPRSGAKTPTPPTLSTPGHDRPPPRAGTQPTLPTPGHSRPLPKAATRPVTARFSETPTLPTPGHGKSPPRAVPQPVTDQFRDELLTLPPGPAAITTMEVPQFSWNMKGGDRPDETIDSGICTLRPRGTSPSLKSLLPDTVIKGGIINIDASMPVLGQNHRFGPWSGVRSRLFGHDMLTPIRQQLADLKADLLPLRRECKREFDSEFGGGRAGTCPHCGVHVMANLSRYIIDFHLALGQLWRCPVEWCSVWKGTAQECMDHQRIRRFVVEAQKTGPALSSLDGDTGGVEIGVASWSVRHRHGRYALPSVRWPVGPPVSSLHRPSLVHARTSYKDSHSRLRQCPG